MSRLIPLFLAMLRCFYRLFSTWADGCGFKCALWIRLIWCDAWLWQRQWLVFRFWLSVRICPRCTVVHFQRWSSNRPQSVRCQWFSFPPASIWGCSRGPVTSGADKSRHKAQRQLSRMLKHSLIPHPPSLSLYLSNPPLSLLSFTFLDFDHLLLSLHLPFAYRFTVLCCQIKIRLNLRKWNRDKSNFRGWELTFVCP